MRQYDLIVVGGGISGMTAALSALESDINDILILERESYLGGVLNQCIHNAFGEGYLKTKVTGTEYINYVEEKIKEYNIDIKVNTTVLEVNENKEITYVSEHGVEKSKAKAIILATGCRERYTGNIAIPTNSITGIYTVGNAHRTIVQEGYMPGKFPVIVANSKWGLIAARRLVIEGAKIQALLIDELDGFVFDDEAKDIIRDFDIPVIENCRIIEALGEERIEEVNILNERTNEVSSISCDCLLLSVGYFPEKDSFRDLKLNVNNITKAPITKDYETSISGIFACGNLIYGIHALEKKDVNGFEAGKSASRFIKKL